MDRSQWISLLFLIVLVIVDVFLLAPTVQSNSELGDRHFPWQRTGEFLVVAACATIWWPDIAGSVLLFNRFGPLSDSWEGAVRCLGWLILFIVAMVRIQYISQILGR